MKQYRNPETVHSPLAAYTHQIEISGPQRWLVLSGQVGMEPDGSLSDDPVRQFEVALENIQRNLEAAGMQVEDLVKLTLFLAVPIDGARRREILSAWLKEHHLCTTLIYVAGLASPAIKVEIEGLACVDD